MGFGQATGTGDSALKEYVVIHARYSRKVETIITRPFFEDYHSQLWIVPASEIDMNTLKQWSGEEPIAAATATASKAEADLAQRLALWRTCLSTCCVTRGKCLRSWDQLDTRNMHITGIYAGYAQ